MEANKAIDYKGIGFACGLEIHQRLATAEKLFCSCSATLSESEAYKESITRSQRAVAGELGMVDYAAKFEEMKGKSFRYNVFKSNTCLVELDEEPPHELNSEALHVSLAISRSLNLKIADELQPMRKEVVDGSNPSAFQRTIMLGSDGYVNVAGRNIPIPMISLEEESAGIEEQNAGVTVYDTDRIGIPLVEIDTDPSIASPQEAKAVALHIGMLLRLTGRVQRGIGTIRQDVNVSIREGARVEIKGVQELDMIDRLVENEVLRQIKLIELRDKLLSRSAGAGSIIDVTEIFRETKARVVANQIAQGGAAVAFALRGFKGVIGAEISPDRRLGSEISDYAKGAGVNGIIHSDEDLGSYGFSAVEIARMKEALALRGDDAFVLVAGRRENAWKAAELAAERAKYSLVGVPLETRAVLDANEGTTRFMRPLPGGSRMYPETDLKPVQITKEMLKLAERDAPNIEKEMEVLNKQAGQRNAADLILSPRLPLYRFVVRDLGGEGELIANVLLQKFTELKRSGFDVDLISDRKVLEIFRRYKEGEITKQGIDELLKALSKSAYGVDEAIKKAGLERIKGAKLKQLVESEMKSHKEEKNIARIIMSKYRLRVDGAELNSILGNA
jgi:glutamyl-tRNA(Gln) amidotransferase subunit E